MTVDAAAARPPTMSDVAARAGVSRQLVSLVMAGKDGPSASSRQSILDAAADLNFRPNISARLLRQDRTRLIGVVFTAQSPFESQFVERLLERAPESQLGVVLAPMTERRTTDVVINELVEHRVEAFACFNPDPGSQMLQRLLDETPVIWLGERSGDKRVDSVRSNDDEGLSLAVRHLIGLGHKRIAYSGGLLGRIGPERAAAYRNAMLSEGLGDFIDEVAVGFFEEDGAVAARRLLARQTLPTAVIACSDQNAAGLLAVFARSGVRVPEDVSVIGYDDSDLAALSYHDLTAVRQDIDLTVDATLDAIKHRLEDPTTSPRDIATRATLTVRSSTGLARSSQAM